MTTPPNMVGPPKLELRGVKKRFGGKAVLAGIDLAVEKGRSLVIIGGSGQGKSVTIKIAIGLMRPGRRQGAGGWARRDTPRREQDVESCPRSSGCCSRARPCSTA